MIIRMASPTSSAEVKTTPFKAYGHTPRVSSLWKGIRCRESPFVNAGSAAPKTPQPNRITTDGHQNFAPPPNGDAGERQIRRCAANGFGGVGRFFQQIRPQGYARHLVRDFRSDAGSSADQIRRIAR